MLHGDTRSGPEGFGTFGSRSVALGGSALARVSVDLRDKGRRIAAKLLEAAPADIIGVPGGFHVAGLPDRRVMWREVATAADAPGHGLPPGDTPGLDATTYFQPEAEVLDLRRHRLRAARRGRHRPPGDRAPRLGGRCGDGDQPAPRRGPAPRKPRPGPGPIKRGLGQRATGRRGQGLSALSGGRAVSEYGLYVTYGHLSLPAEKSQLERSDFMAWVDPYLKAEPSQPYQYRGLDVYAARCAVLQAFSAEAELHRKDPGVRLFGYHDGRDHISHPHLVLIGIASFVNDIVAAIEAFFAAFQDDAALKANVEPRLVKVLHTFPIQAP